MKNKIMTRNVFPQLPLQIFSRNADGCNPTVSEDNANVWAASAKRTLRWSGVLNMRERVGKKQLRLPARSLRSLDCSQLHFEKKFDRMRELEKHCVS